MEEPRGFSEATQEYIKNNRDRLLDTIKPDCRECLTAQRVAVSVAEFALQKCVSTYALAPHFKSVLSECKEGLEVVQVGACGSKKVCHHPNVDSGGAAIAHEIIDRSQTKQFTPSEENT